MEGEGGRRDSGQIYGAKAGVKSVFWCHLRVIQAVAIIRALVIKAT